eukprot:15465043-Alexandrium_andersonii.AAC.1
MPVQARARCWTGPTRTSPSSAASLAGAAAPGGVRRPSRPSAARAPAAVPRVASEPALDVSDTRPSSLASSSSA